MREMNEQCKESTKEEGVAGGGTAISMSQRNKLKDNKRETGWVSKPPTARTSSFRFRGRMERWWDHHWGRWGGEILDIQKRTTSPSFSRRLRLRISFSAHFSVFDINLQCNGGLERGRGPVFSGYSWISWHGDQLAIEHPQPEKVKVKRMPSP